MPRFIAVGVKIENASWSIEFVQAESEDDARDFIENTVCLSDVQIYSPAEWRDIARGCENAEEGEYISRETYDDNLTE